MQKRTSSSPHAAVAAIAGVRRSRHSLQRAVTTRPVRARKASVASACQRAVRTNVTPFNARRTAHAAARTRGAARERAAVAEEAEGSGAKGFAALNASVGASAAQTLNPTVGADAAGTASANRSAPAANGASAAAAMLLCAADAAAALHEHTRTERDAVPHRARNAAACRRWR